ncbi:ADP-ribosylglycohydrolase family protein [Nocardiopsis sp. LOL_012]|uniref:ADP-ribosylglycohydrolase family protein n=1 Tax=Nocardiopsis sp. LOL_012 TaxID=3345409 RepID=UPI003A88EB42
MKERIEQAVRSLRGLALGEAYGHRRSRTDDGERGADAGHRTQEGPWPWSDGTATALSVLSCLAEHGRTDREHLAAVLAAGGQDGEEPHGSGAAVRVAPLGAYFADDLDRVPAEAARCAVVTHTRPEAVAGAVAVALAAALAAAGGDRPAPGRPSFLDQVSERLEPSEVRSGLRRAARLPASTAPEQAARALGGGADLSAPGTVPFALWCAAEGLDDPAGTLRRAVAGTRSPAAAGAIAGGVAAARSGVAGVPQGWRQACEGLPAWVEALSPAR